MNPLLAIGLVAVGLAAGAAIGYVVFSRLIQKPATDEKEAEKVLDEARKEAERTCPQRWTRRRGHADFVLGRPRKHRLAR